MFTIAFPFPVLPSYDGFVGVTSLHYFTVNSMIDAYSKGIYPWFIEAENVYWFSPFPRLVLYTNAVTISKSMKQILKNNPYTITINTASKQLIDTCSEVHHTTGGTWLDAIFAKMYMQLSDIGMLQTVEVWEGNELVGGLVGNILGHMAYGETMFNTRPNTSKLALIYWCSHLAHKNIPIIDCQQDSMHLRSMGARLINSELFQSHLPFTTHKFPFTNHV